MPSAASALTPASPERLRHRCAGDAAAVDIQAAAQVLVVHHRLFTPGRQRQPERQRGVVQRVAAMVCGTAPGMLATQ